MRPANIAGNFTKDLLHALASLGRVPGYAVVLIVTLALGIGATTAIFSVVYGVLFKPLPFADQDRLVGVGHQGFNQGPGSYFTYRDNNQVFEDVGAWESNQASITDAGEPERVESLAVTAAILPLLRVQPLIGRFFSEADDQPGSPQRVVLAYGYWQRQFGGARDVIGKLLRIDGVPSEIIGVLPVSFRFLRTNPALLLPMQLDRADPSGFDFQAIARLKPGVTVSQANADMARMIPLLPPQYKGFRLKPDIQPLIREVIGDVSRILWILLATVGIVLLIACANAANLFLVRTEGRQQEIAVRAALGAGRTGIARALLAESLVLSLAGGVAGVLLAQAGIALLRWLAPTNLPRLEEIAIDPIVLLFATVISLFSGFLFGTISVWRFGAPNSAALKEGGRAISDGRERIRTRDSLVVAEVAMAVVLLVASGLMIRTFRAMLDVNPGFIHPEQVQTFHISVPDAVIADPLHMARTHAQIAERLQQLPGVSSVGFASSITMDGEDNGNVIEIERIDEPQPRPFRRFKSIGPGYFETMGNPFVAGRAIDWNDIYNVRPVVVISENLARTYWSDPAQAIGKRIRGGEIWHEIVGVSGDERDDGLNRTVTPIVYWPLLNEPYQRRDIAYVVRSSRVGSSPFLREIRQVVSSVYSSLPLSDTRTLAEIVAVSMAQTTFAMIMLAIAAFVALALGVVGIYGVMAYVAAQRSREVGIRIALGAQRGEISGLFLRHGLLLAGVGTAVGVTAALALGRVMSSLLFGVSSSDPLTYAVVAIGLGSVALLATWIPARRAARVDPAVALRADR